MDIRFLTFVSITVALLTRGNAITQTVDRTFSFFWKIKMALLLNYREDCAANMHSRLVCCLICPSFIFLSLFFTDMFFPFFVLVIIITLKNFLLLLLSRHLFCISISFPYLLKISDL